MAQDKVAEIIKFTGAGEPPAPAQPVAPPAPDEAGHAGALLAAARAAAGLSVEAVSEAIKLKAAHVAAIEAMRADLLPAMPYAVGFVRTYARFLNLDAEAVAARFRAEIAGAAPAEAPASRETVAAAPPGNEGARLAWVFAIFAIVLFALWVIVQVLSGAGDAPSAPAPAVSVAAPQPQAAPAPELSAEGSQPAEDMAPGGLEAAADGETVPPDAAGETSAAVPGAGEAASAAAPEAAMPAPSLQPEAQPLETAPAGAATPDVPHTAAAPEERPLPRRPRPAPPARAPEVVEAALVRSPAPAYPERCTRAARDLESVTVMFDVSEAGRAVNVRVVSSTNACFNGEALSALSRWRFEPRTVDGAASLEAGKSATLNFRK